MNISNDDRNRWQQWGTTQQDAAKAGTIFGPLSGASDLQKIAFEQQQALYRQMEAQRGTGVQLHAHGGHSGRHTSRAIKVLVLAPIAIVLMVIATGVATTPNTAGVNREHLISGTPDPKVYAANDPKILALSKEGAAKLLDTHFKTIPARKLEGLNEQQQAAVQAIWLRYLKDPKAFLRLSDHQQHLSLVLFDMYLLELGDRTGNVQPYIDRGRLYLTGLDSLNVPYSAQDKRAQSAWFDGALALPQSPELSVLASEGSWDDMLYRHFIQGWRVLRGLLPGEQ